MGVILPPLIVHCDWGSTASKRWVAKAVLKDGHYTASKPELVGELPTLIQRLAASNPGPGPTLVGFDFPIGLPNAYIEKTNAASFLQFFSVLQPESSFFNVCRNRTQISLERPFYPFTPGEKRLAHLTDALEIEAPSLLRKCDQANESRPSAAAPFWTIGAKQVGKAAIIGWRDVLIPALEGKQAQIWPFHGQLDTLLKTGTIVVSETYPAQYYQDIFGALNGPKSSQVARRNVAQAILDWTGAQKRTLRLDPELRQEIEAGFTQGNDDAFDAVIGLFGMIHAVQDWDRSFEPQNPTLRNIEGWILGQPVPEQYR